VTPAAHPVERRVGHPGPQSVAIPAAMVQAMIDHARAEEPNEACGLVIGDRAAADGGRALRWVPCRNRLASRYRYEIHPEDLLRLTIETEDADETFWAIVHSHTHTPARPSPTDLAQAFYPDALYILVSLADEETDAASGVPSLRAWRIVDGRSFEVELQVVTGTGASRRTMRPVDAVPLALGLAALVVGTAFGWDARLVDAVVGPPAAARAALVALAVIGGLGLLAAGLRRMAARGGEALGSVDLGAMIGGVRLVFLGVASLAAAVGWLAGHPLPLVIALIIAGVDVVETSFLLLVVRGRRSA